MATPDYPTGLKVSQLAWGGNITVRSGRISPRSGYQPVIQGQTWQGGTSGLFQGAFMYLPQGANPYIIMGVGGHTFKVDVETDVVTDISIPATVRESGQPQWWFVQAEQFLVIQDGSGEPNVWDGSNLRRISAMGGPAPFLPVGTAMDYFMGRIWLALPGALGRQYIGGDIVAGPSGTAAYRFFDSVLHTVENTYIAGGGTFVVPANDGIIRAIFHTAELDTSLGQGRLYVGTRNNIYAVNVPVTRTLWNAASNVNIPVQTVALQKFGPVGDRSVVAVNSDAFFQTLEPGIRSLTLATRFFQQWGNTQISNNEERVLNLNDRALLRYSSGILFDNRLFQTALPFTTSVGVAHRGIIPLDFDLISALDEKYPPAWEGMNQGLQVLQMVVGDFGGLERAFAIVLSDASVGGSGNIEVWEITRDGLRDNGPSDNRINWFVEFPSYAFGDLKQLKRLVGGRIWYDNVVGDCLFTLEYRGDSSQCWNLWTAWEDCSSRSCVEAEIPCGYPVQPLCPGNKSPASFPKPPSKCDPSNNRPTNIAYQFQARLTVKGSCDIRGFFLQAEPVMEQAYYRLIC